MKINILFVCMGNICRSPSAEAVMTAYVKKAKLSDKIFCDSAGTIGYHEGEKADARMQKHAKKRNYELTSISRKLQSSDFESFDHIVAMDNQNIEDIKMFMPNGVKAKLSKMTDYCSQPNPGYVPDPYYGGAEGFERVLDLLEDACKGFLIYIKNEYTL